MGYFRENVEQSEGYTPGFQPGNTEVTKLNTNENPYPPSPMVMEAIRSVTPEQLRRYPDPVGTSFRQAAAQLNGLDPDNIICCNGGDDLLSMAIRAFCDENRPLAYPVPTYSLYPVLAKLEGCPTIEIPFDDEYNLPAKLASTKAALTIVCNPNAPSGTQVDISELASLADEIEGVLLIDEAYVDFAEFNCVELVRNCKNVIILRSMSKGYSLAGMRFGYGMANKELIAGLMKVKDSYNVDAVAIAAATAAIKDQKYLKENVQKVKQQRAILTGQLGSLGFEVKESCTNFLLAKCKGVNAQEIYNKLVEKNVFVRYFKLPGLEDKLRITVGTAEQNARLIEVLFGIVNK